MWVGGGGQGQAAGVAGDATSTKKEKTSFFLYLEFFH
jgi:hypothetical protein